LNRVKQPITMGERTLKWFKIWLVNKHWSPINQSTVPYNQTTSFKTCGWTFESFIQWRVFVLMKRASKFPCAKIFYPFIFVFGSGQSLLIVNIFNCWAFPSPISHFL
jgi:hypothetical protein